MGHGLGTPGPLYKVPMQIRYSMSIYHINDINYHIIHYTINRKYQNGLKYYYLKLNVLNTIIELTSTFGHYF